MMTNILKGYIHEEHEVHHVYVNRCVFVLSKISTTLQIISTVA